MLDLQCSCREKIVERTEMNLSVSYGRAARTSGRSSAIPNHEGQDRMSHHVRRWNEGKLSRLGNDLQATFLNEPV